VYNLSGGYRLYNSIFGNQESMPVCSGLNIETQLPEKSF